MNLITLSIDNTFNNPGVGTPGITNTDTRHPMYIGGLPDPTAFSGVETQEQFVGCIKDLEIRQNNREVVSSSPPPAPRERST